MPFFTQNPSYSAGAPSRSSFMASMSNPYESMAMPALRSSAQRLRSALAMQRPGQMPEGNGYTQFRMNPGSLGQEYPQSRIDHAASVASGNYSQPRLGVDQSGFGRRHLSPLGRPGPGEYNGPMYGQTAGAAPLPRDQYGLSRPLGQGNVTPAYGAPAGIPGRMRSGESGLLGSLGDPGRTGSSVYSIGGRNVVVGGATKEMMQDNLSKGMSPAEAYSLASKERDANGMNAADRARATNQSNPGLASVYARQNQQWQDRMQEKAALQSYFRSKKLGLPVGKDVAGVLSGIKPGGVAGSFGNGMTSVQPLSGAVDVADQEMKSSRDMLGKVSGDFNHLGISGYANLADVPSVRMIDALESPEFAQTSPEGRKLFLDTLGHYMRANPKGKVTWTNPEYHDAIHDYLYGDKNKYRKIVAERKRKMQDIHENSGLMPLY